MVGTNKKLWVRCKKQEKLQKEYKMIWTRKAKICQMCIYHYDKIVHSKTNRRMMTYNVKIVIQLFKKFFCDSEV